MESKGLKENKGKTEVMVSGRNGTKVNIKDKEGRELNQVDQFKYLGGTFSEEGGSETAVRARVKAAWQKWRELGPVFFFFSFSNALTGASDSRQKDTNKVKDLSSCMEQNAGRPE